MPRLVPGPDDATDRKGQGGKSRWLSRSVGPVLLFGGGREGRLRRFMFLLPGGSEPVSPWSGPAQAGQDVAKIVPLGPMEG